MKFFLQRCGGQTDNGLPSRKLRSSQLLGRSDVAEYDHQNERAHRNRRHNQRAQAAAIMLFIEDLAAPLQEYRFEIHWPDLRKAHNDEWRPVELFAPTGFSLADSATQMLKGRSGSERCRVAERRESKPFTSPHTGSTCWPKFLLMAPLRQQFRSVSGARYVSIIAMCATKRLRYILPKLCLQVLDLTRLVIPVSNRYRP